MKRHTFLLGALALGAFTAFTNAQEKSHSPVHDPATPGHSLGMRGDRVRPHIPGLLAVLDPNRDGVIDTEELGNAPAALQRLDRNGDGSVAFEELPPPRPPRPARAPAHGPAPAHVPEISEDETSNPTPPAKPAAPPPPPATGPMLSALDANKDAVVDSDELANATAALQSLDKNGDGQLTGDEYQGQRLGRARAERRERQQEGRRPGPRHALGGPATE